MENVRRKVADAFNVPVEVLGGTYDVPSVALIHTPDGYIVGFDFSSKQDEAAYRRCGHE